MYGQKLSYCYKAVPKTIFFFFLSLYVCDNSLVLGAEDNKPIAIRSDSIGFLYLLVFCFLFPSSSFYPAVGVSLPVLPFLSSNFQSTKWLANGISCTANNKKSSVKEKTNRTDHLFHFSFSNRI